MVDTSPATSFTPGGCLGWKRMCWTSGSSSCADYESGHWSMTELCERYGVTRPTGYKWLARHRAGGRAGLADRSRAPHHVPAPDERRHGGADRRGAPGVRLGGQEAPAGAPESAPERSWPARSTVNDVLERHQLLRKNRRRRTWTHPGATPCRPTTRIRCGPPTSKGSSRRAMASTAIP